MIVRPMGRYDDCGSVCEGRDKERERERERRERERERELSKGERVFE